MMVFWKNPALGFLFGKNRGSFFGVRPVVSATTATLGWVLAIAILAQSRSINRDF
jgi:hypothetical protein